MQNILFSQQQAVATVTLNRPEVGNAFDATTIGELTTLFRNIAADDSVRVVLLKGNGKHFCAGGDLNWMRAAASYNDQENVEDAKRLGEMLHALNTLPQATIALVHGAAYGGGVGLASACDIALGTEVAQFCLSEVKLGLMPSVIGPYVIAAMGQRAARRYFVTAEVIDAKTAREHGLLHEVFASVEEMHISANQFAETLLKNAPGAIADTKKLIAEISGRRIDMELVNETAKWIAERRSTDEGKAGVEAFLAKKQAPWIVGKA